MPAAPLDLADEFRSRMAPNSVRVATPSDAVCGVLPQLILEPAGEAELASALRLASDAGLAVIPRGGGSKMAWGNAPSRADIILSTKRLDKITEHVWADLTVTVEAGCSIQALQTALARHNQRLAIDPLWPERATVGGILSTNDSGALRLRFGSLRDLIIGVTIALPDGTLASSGGKVVKNVAGYDLPKLVTGALGTLGVITRAVFRLHPVPRNTKTFTIAAASLHTMQRLLLAVQDSQLAHTSLQVRMVVDAGPLLDVLFEGTEEGIAAQHAQFQALVSPLAARESPQDVWRTCQEFWNSLDSRSSEQPGAIAKITTLPAAVAQTIESVRAIAERHQASWTLCLQAIGAGLLLLEASPDQLRAAVSDLRAALERAGASLVIRQRPASLPALDAWGHFGDALPLMRAVRMKFDPRSTLNPSRFL
ncbi:MAG TPA: FAD-binding oxidoreductase [Candidatus Acidoferrum sp.]|nr:FAD-binding oxidoreductase [Candidatus Acidoferrum sp.]